MVTFVLEKPPNQMIGAYVQDKVSQLVNSITICRAMRRCEVGEEKPIDSESIQKELFPTSQPVRSEHYDKVKSRRQAK